MSAISFERYYILYKTINVKRMKSKIAVRSIIISILLSLFWSTAPLLGWSHYTLEDGLVSCSVEYKDTSLNVFSYNVCMFIFVFIIPFGMIVVTNLRAFYIVNIYLVIRN